MCLFQQHDVEFALTCRFNITFQCEIYAILSFYNCGDRAILLQVLSILLRC